MIFVDDRLHMALAQASVLLYNTPPARSCNICKFGVS